MLHRNVENFIGCDSSYRTAGIVLYGAPFDSTTSYRPGARFGPAAIRHESYGLETYSPYQDKDLTDCNVFDSGDLELCFGSSESALVDIESRAAEILRDGKLPLLLGGEHLVTLGAVRAAVKKYPDLHIVHFDAHADLRDDYLGAQLSHACVLRRCHDLLGDGRIHQFCIRSGDREEFQFAARHTDIHKFDFTGLQELTDWLCQANVPVYLTIDLDCLDPSAFPGTGTPEAGGVSFLQLLGAIRTVTKANIIGADVNELAPMLDQSGVSTATACKVLRELLLALDCDVELYKAGRMPIAQFAVLPYDRDILTHVYIKKTPGLAVHYQSVRATQTDFPILTCAGARTADGAYRFAIGARPMKAMLVCPTAAPDELPAAVQAAVPTGSNLRGSAAYRTHLVGVLVKRAVQALGNLEVL